MSTGLDPHPPTPSLDDELPAPPSQAAPRGRGGVALWARVGLAVLLLGASAAERAWQSRRVDQALRDGRTPPFDLADLPMTLGPWVGKTVEMDPIIARATGSTGQIQRMYQNTVTGQKLELLVLYGPSSEMYIHAPEVCYPAAGYERVAGPVGRDVGGDGKSWRFDDLVYARGEGGTGEQQEVYYTWRYAGRWSPAMVSPKGAERLPGMFKVQVARTVREREVDVRNYGNPTEAFLVRLMPEIDSRIAASAHH